MTDKIIINEVSLNPLKWFKSKENSDDSVKVNKFQLSDLRNEFIASFIGDTKIRLEDGVVEDTFKTAAWFNANKDAFKVELDYIMKGSSYFFDTVVNKLSTTITSEQALKLFKNSSKYNILYHVMNIIQKDAEHEIFARAGITPLEKHAKASIEILKQYSDSIKINKDTTQMIKTFQPEILMDGKLVTPTLTGETANPDKIPVVLFAISLGLCNGNIKTLKEIYDKLCEYTMNYLLRTIRFLTRTTVYFKEYPIKSDDSLKQEKRPESFFADDVETDADFSSERSAKQGGSLEYGNSKSPMKLTPDNTAIGSYYDKESDDSHEYMRPDLTTDLRPNSTVIKYKFNSKKHRFEGEHLKGLTQTDFIDYHQIVSITDKKKIVEMLKKHIYNFARLNIHPDPARKWTLTYVLDTNSRGAIKAIINDLLMDIMLMIGKYYSLGSSLENYENILEFQAGLCDNVLTISFNKLDKKEGILNKLFNKSEQNGIYASVLLNIDKIVNNKLQSKSNLNHNMVGKKVLQENENEEVLDESVILAEIKGGVIFDLNTLNESEVLDEVEGLYYVNLHSTPDLEIRHYSMKSIIESLLNGHIVKHTSKPIFGNGSHGYLYLYVDISNGVEILNVEANIPEESYLRLDIDVLKELMMWGSSSIVESNKDKIIKYFKQVVDGHSEFHGL